MDPAQDDPRALREELDRLRARLERARRAEQALDASEALTGRILQMVPCGVVHVGPDGAVLVANEQAQRFLGLSYDSLSDRYIADFSGETYHEDGRLCAVQDYPVAVCLATGEPQPPMTIGVRQPGGELRWAIFTALPFATGDGTGAIVTLVDITERKRAEAQVAQADRLASVGALAAGVAHEINNPLAYILLNLESTVATVERLEAGCAAIEQAAAGDLRTQVGEVAAELGDLAAEVRDAVDGAIRVRDIVRDLMTFARTSEDRRSPIDVNASVRVALKMADHEIRYRAALHTDFGELPAVFGHGGRLSQVFLNLLLNAARAIPEGHVGSHRIGVVTHAADGRVVVEISDTGSGIAPEHLHRLFDPFFTTRNDGTGTGLGLAICHSIVSAHGGAIHVDSTPGAGATFRVELPAMDRRVPVAAAPTPATAPLRPPLRILLVDDDLLVRKAIATLLEAELGYQCVAVGSCAEVRDLVARDTAFDVVLCDMMMLDGSGVDVYDHLRDHAAALADRTIFMTGGAFTPRALAFLERVSAPRLLKPFSLAELSAAARTVTGASS
jgi:PAS domain S-box-containing protein